MKFSFSKTVISLITAPIVLLGLVLPTAAMADAPPTTTSANITGTPQTGQTLTAHANGVTGSPLNAIEYFWAVCTTHSDELCFGENVASVLGNGVDELTYTVEPDWEGWCVYVTIVVSTGSDANRTEVVRKLSYLLVQPYLDTLALSFGTLSPTFDPATATGSSASVSNATSSISVTPTVSIDWDTYTIQARVNSGSYASVTSGSASGSPAFNVGSNTIDVKVTAEDGPRTNAHS